MTFLPINEVANLRLKKIHHRVGLEIDILRREMHLFQERNDIHLYLFEVLLCDVRTQIMMLSFVQSVYKKKNEQKPLYDHEALKYIRSQDKSEYEKFSFIPQMNAMVDQCNAVFRTYNEVLMPILKQLEPYFVDYNKVVNDILTAYINEHPYGLTMAMANKMYFEGLDYEIERIVKMMASQQQSNTLLSIDETTNQFVIQAAVPKTL